MPHLLCLPERKEFSWEHQSEENKKSELQVCVQLPRAGGCPEAAMWAQLGSSVYVQRMHRGSRGSCGFGGRGGAVDLVSMWLWLDVEG